MKITSRPANKKQLAFEHSVESLQPSLTEDIFQLAFDFNAKLVINTSRKATQKRLPDGLAYCAGSCDKILSDLPSRHYEQAWSEEEIWNVKGVRITQKFCRACTAALGG